MNKTSEKIDSDNEIPLDLDMALKLSVFSFFSGSVFGFLRAGQTIDANIPRAVQVEKAIDGSMRGGLHFGLATGVLIASGDVMKNLRQKKDMWNYVAGGIPATLVSTIFTQQYALKPIASKVVGFSMAGAVYSTLLDRREGLQRHISTCDEKLSFMEKAEYFFTQAPGDVEM